MMLYNIRKFPPYENYSLYDIILMLNLLARLAVMSLCNFSLNRNWWICREVKGHNGYSVAAVLTLYSYQKAINLIMCFVGVLPHFIYLMFDFVHLF